MTAGRGVAGPKPQAEETVPPVVVSSSSSSSSSWPAATSVPVKQEVNAEGKADAVDPDVIIDDEAQFKDHWEPGNWCWLLDDDANNWNSAPEVGVKSEAAAVKQEEDQNAGTKEQNEKISDHATPHDVLSAAPVVPAFSSSPSPAGRRSKKEEHNAETDTTTLRRRCKEDGKTEMDDAEHDEDDVRLIPQLRSSFSTSPPTIGLRSIKEDTKENNTTTTNNIKLRRREDAEGNEKGHTSEHDDATAVKSEGKTGIKEEEKELNSKQDEDDVALTPQLLSSFSSSPPTTTGLRSIKEETKENNNNNTNNNKLRRRRDDEERNEKGYTSEHDAAAPVSSTSRFVRSSIAANPSTTGIRSQKGNQEVQIIKLHPDDDDNDDDDKNNNDKIRHSTDRSVKSDMNSDDGGRSDNTIATTTCSTLGTTDPDPLDDTWRAGSWCWVPVAPKSGSRSDGVASVAAGFTGNRRSTKRKASEQARESKFENSVRNKHNNQNKTIAVTNRSLTDRQQHDPCDDDNWTTSCWCWESPSTNSGISDVALAAATSTGRRKKRKGSEQSRESRCIIRSKNHTTIGHHTRNNYTDIDEDEDTDAIVELCGDQHDDDDDNDGTVSDHDFDDDSDDNDATTFSDKRWNKMYSRLVKYKKTYKSLTVTKKFNDRYNLQEWTRDQRHRYKRNILCVNRINRLNSIDFVWNVHDTYWIRMYARLVAYKKQYKSTSVPESYPADPPLASWVDNQRAKYRTKNPSLTIDRIGKLNSIGFVWNVLDAQWTEMYERLIAHKKQNTSMCIPKIYQKDTRLGRWISQQRTSYNTNRPSLTANRITQLESIGFVWNALDAQWMEKYERLVKYKKQNKTTLVPFAYPVDPQLGVWVQKQRSNYHTNKSRLTADRISRLNSIGFAWKIKTNNVYL